MLALHLPLHSAADINDEKWEDFNPKQKGIENEEKWNIQKSIETVLIPPGKGWNNWYL